MSKSPAQVTTIGIFVLVAFSLFLLLLVSFGGGRIAARTFDYKMYFYTKVRGLKVGSPVMFRGVKIGQVSQVSLASIEDLKPLECHEKDHGKGGVLCEPFHDLGESRRGSADNRRFPIEVVISLDPECLGVPQGLWIRIFQKDREDIQYLQALMKELVCVNGLGGELQTMSLLTGQLYIELVFREFVDKHEEERTIFLYSKQVLPVHLSPMQMLNEKLQSTRKKISPAESLYRLMIQISEFINNGGAENFMKNMSEISSNINKLSANGNVVLEDGHRAMKQLQEDVHVMLKSLNATIADLSAQAKDIAENLQTATAQMPRMMDKGSDALTKLDSAMVELNRMENKINEVLKGLFPTEQSGQDLKEELDALLVETAHAMSELRNLLNSMARDPQMLIMGQE